MRLLQPHTHFDFCCRLLRLLGDFGLVRLLESTCELAHSRVGTPYYLSPVPWESLGAGRSRTERWGWSLPSGNFLPFAIENGTWVRGFIH